MSELIDNFLNDDKYEERHELRKIIDTKELQYNELINKREKQKKKKVDPGEPELGEEDTLKLLEPEWINKILKLRIESDEGNGGIVIYNLKNS